MSLCMVTITIKDKVGRSQRVSSHQDVPPEEMPMGADLGPFDFELC